MAPKLKTWMKPTKKGLTTRIRRIAHRPQDLFSSNAGFTTEDESEPTLQDVMNALRTLTTRVAATAEKRSTSSRTTSEAPPLTGSVTMFTLPPAVVVGSIK